MNKKFIISISVAVVMSLTVAYADNTTIYTDGIGRIHFLGRDGGNGAKYTNSAEQDLTRRLYEKSAGEITTDDEYSQHPLKNYENTFPDSRFTTNKKWKTKPDEERVNENFNKTVVTTTKGATDYTGQYQYGSTILDNPQKDENVVKTTTKKHWWQRNKD